MSADEAHGNGLPEIRAPENLEPIPPQGPGPHFVLSAEGRIALAGPGDVDSEGNHRTRIEQLLPLVLRSADELRDCLGHNASPQLIKDLDDYLRAARKQDYREVSWALLYGLGVRLENAALAARREVDGGVGPPLGGIAQAALDSLLSLHGPLILATSEGRSLQELADRNRMTRSEQAAFRARASHLAEQLDAAGMLDPQAADVTAKSVATIGDGRFPDRGTAFGMATIKNVATVLIGASSLAAIGLTIGGPIGLGVAWTGHEVLKKSKIYGSAVAALGPEFDRLFEAGGDAVKNALLRLMPFLRFVQQNRETLRNIAEDSNSSWMLRHIDIMTNEGMDYEKPRFEVKILDDMHHRAAIISSSWFERDDKVFMSLGIKDAGAEGRISFKGFGDVYPEFPIRNAYSPDSSIDFWTEQKQEMYNIIINRQSELYITVWEHREESVYFLGLIKRKPRSILFLIARSIIQVTPLQVR